jgi:toxin CcdB
MAQYTVYRNIDGAGYLLDVQSDIIRNFSTRVVVPLVAQDEIPEYAKTLNPVFEVEGELVVMATQGLAAVPSKILKEPVASLVGNRTEIVQALDILFQGI